MRVYYNAKRTSYVGGYILTVIVLQYPSTTATSSPEPLLFFRDVTSDGLDSGFFFPKAFWKKPVKLLDFFWEEARKGAGAGVPDSFRVLPVSDCGLFLSLAKSSSSL